MAQLNYRQYRIFILILVVLVLSSCTAGGDQFSQETPAGFWWGIWHGIISIISLVVHMFNENVAVYETHNTGGWYDFGFLAGVILVWGGGCHMNCKSGERKEAEKEWDEIGEKVEKKVMRKLQEWAQDEDTSVADKDWDEIGEKVEKKLKRKIREWAEKE
jgi:hypothetical protein